MNTFLDLNFDIEELRNESAPVYYKYASQFEPQNAYVAIDCEMGSIDVGYDTVIGNAVPREVAYGRTRRFTIPADVSGQALADLIESHEFLELAERIYNGIEISWAGNNSTGIANADAQEAEDSLSDLLAELEDKDARIQVWDTSEWLFSSGDLEDSWQDEPLHVAVQRIKEVAQEEGVHLDGSISTALLEEAFDHFQNGEELLLAHIDALLANKWIDRDEVDEYLGNSQ
jgi:hypothetical protein